MPMSPIKKNVRDKELSAGPAREALRRGLFTCTEGLGSALQTQKWLGHLQTANEWKFAPRYYC